MLKTIIEKQIFNNISPKLDNISVKSYEEVLDILDEINKNEEQGIFQLKIINIKKLFNESITIIDKMNKHYKKFNMKNNIFFESQNKISMTSLLTELNNFPSFKSNSKDSIHSEISKVNQKSSYKMIINQKVKCKIHFYFKNEDYSEDKLNENVERLSKIIYVFCNSFGNFQTEINNFNFRFLLIDFPRRLCLNNKQLSFDDLASLGLFNNSSGFTNVYKKEMVLSRNSGLTGLLIHELIHLLHLDFNFWEQNIKGFDFYWKKDWMKYCNMIECSMHVKSNCGSYSFTEGICNTNSSYFLAIYSGIEHFNASHSGNKLVDLNRIKNLASIYYIVEYLHSYINCCKVIKFFGFDTFNSFFNNTSNRKFYQSAHVFEYIVLRMFLITDFYLLLFPRIKNFSQDKNNQYENYLYQKKINNHILSKFDKYDNIESLFNIIIKSMENICKSNEGTIEYFATNFTT